MKKETAAWVRKAEADLVVVRSIRDKVPPVHDAVCFHCQQASEKYLKALLVEHGAAVPKTHDLDRLLTLLLPIAPLLELGRRGLLFLSSFAAETRYPGKNATKRQAKAAHRWAMRVRDEIRKHLGLRTKP